MARAKSVAANHCDKSVCQVKLSQYASRQFFPFVRADGEAHLAVRQCIQRVQQTGIGTRVACQIPPVKIEKAWKPCAEQLFRTASRAG